MSNLNKVMIIGRLGQDPEVRYMPSGTAVVNLSVATSEKWKDKNGEKQERVEWHRVSAFDKLAEIMEKCLTKGSQVYIEGRLQTRKYQAKDGSDRYATEIIAQQMQMLGGGERKERSESSARREQRPAPTQDEAPFSDDIPFAFAFLAPAALIVCGLFGAVGYVA